MKNWAGNFTYRASAARVPETISELQEMIASAPKVRALGTRHSFNSIADTTGEHISLQRLNKIVGIDSRQMTVTVQAGVRYGDLGEYLHQHGYALANLASLPHISVAGACATATHGSGDRNGNLATSVVAMDIVKADGQLAPVSRQICPDTFDAMPIHLGALGVVGALTLKIMPDYQLRQYVYENLSWQNMEKHFDEITGSGYSVSFFTDWQGQTINQVWRKCPLGAAAPMMEKEFFGATPASSDLHPIAILSAENCTAQCGVPGPWHERLPHFRMAFTPSSGDELQSEYFVARQDAIAAIGTVRELADQIGPHLFITEIRTIAADDLWLSPCYKQPSVSIHFTLKPHWPEVQKLLPLIEQKLSKFQTRPHWGKIFTLSPERVKQFYPKLNEFRSLAEQFDPTGKFRNEFLAQCIFGEG